MRDQMTSALTKYAACIADAASDASNGCQIPDDFAFPSNCSYFETVFHITAVASTAPAGNQNFDLLVTPSLFGAFCGTGTCTGGGVIAPGTVGNGNNTTIPGWTWISPISSQFVSAGGILSTQAQIAQTLNQYEKYRIVGVGVEVIDDTQDLSANGTFNFCEFPLGQHMPVFSTTAPISFVQLLQFLDCPGFDATQGNPATTNPMITENISSLPVKARIGYRPFLDSGGTRWSARPVAPDSLEWRDPFNDVGPYNQGMICNLAGGGAVAGGFLSITMQSAGGSANSFTQSLVSVSSTPEVGSVLQSTTAIGGPLVGAVVTGVTLVGTTATITYSPAASIITTQGGGFWSVPIGTATGVALDPEYLKVGGSTAMALRFVAPFNAAGANATLTSVNVRIRYHIEGLVTVGSTNGTTANGNTGHPAGGLISSNPKAMEAILNMGARQTKFLSPSEVTQQRNMMMNVAASLS